VLISVELQCSGVREKRINRELYGRSIICHVKVSEDYPLNFDLWRFLIIYYYRFVPAQGLELAGKPYAWIKRIPNSSCARLSAGIARPVTWKKKKKILLLFYFYFFFLTRLCCCAHLGKVQANALTFYCAIYDQTCGCVYVLFYPQNYRPAFKYQHAIRKFVCWNMAITMWNCILSITQI
jgi:hypothetical protein